MTFLDEVLLDGIIDTLKLIPFLFLTYLLMEFIEHKASDRAEEFMKRAGKLAPVAGGLLGIVPQCGISASAANLYTGRIVSMGTLIAVFLSASDEMLPLMIGGGVPFLTLLPILLGKAAIGILAGLTVDLFVRRKEPHINVDEICEHDRCHCEKGVLHSAIHHTLTISLFLLLVTLAINALVFFIGEDAIAGVMYGKPVISHVIAAVIGLVPNCAASVALTQFWLDGFITLGTMLAGLLPGAGVGLLVLFRVNRHEKENFLIVGILLAVGILAGILTDVTGLSSLLSV